MLFWDIGPLYKLFTGQPESTTSTGVVAGSESNVMPKNTTSLYGIIGGAVAGAVLVILIVVLLVIFTIRSVSAWMKLVFTSVMFLLIICVITFNAYIFRRRRKRGVESRDQSIIETQGLQILFICVIL